MSALLHDVGRSRREKNHHKASYRLISALVPPLGWKAQELRLVAAVARHHRGVLPRPGQKSMAEIALAERQQVIRLSAVLRLADALDGEHDGRISRVSIRKKDGYLIVDAAGYSPRSAMGEKIAGARHLLELSCRCPIWVKGTSTRNRRLSLVKPRQRN
jgi:exopolyphosphatase/guanosine-5'-triphosphate,3'-diphosphate pyrophosphatase